MTYNKFIISVFIRVLLLSFNSFLILYFFSKEERIFTIALFSVLLLGQIWFLYKYVSKSNQDLANFLLYLEKSDSTLSFSENRFDSIRSKVGQRFTSILNEIKEVKFEKERKEGYLKALIGHINIGFLSYDDTGKIIYDNKAAKKIINKEVLLNIHDLKKQNAGLYQKLNNLKPGESTVYKDANNTFHPVLSLKKSIVKNEKTCLSLLTIQDIKNELEENELQSYQKLIRVITHEMMNSLTPITTLTSTIKRNLSDINKIPDHEKIKDSIISSELIEERSKGLIDFIQRYRQFTNLPKPVFREVNIENLLLNVGKFIESENHRKIKIEIETNPKDLSIKLDQHLIEQVLINLLKNALEAIQNQQKGEITIVAKADEIKVSDNGSGIADEIKDEVFVPFFTTKENGSGIGLSLCRQIMYLHHGSISLESKKGKGSTFTLNFHS